MSTDLQIAKLLKGLGESYSLFSGKEESFLLQLVCSSDGVEFPSDLDSQRLSHASFILPEVHSKRELVPAGNKKLLVAAYKSFHQNLSNSAHKLAHLARLSEWFREAGLKVVFMKGGAELAYFKDNVQYLGRRSMSDLDALCPADQLQKIDKLLLDRGYKLFSIDALSTDRMEIIEHCVSKHSHVVYDAWEKNHLEIHPDIAADFNADSYPPDFSELILNEARQVEVSGSKVWVPRPEHLLVQFFCHAASKKDHEDVLYPRDILVEFCNGSMEPYSVIVNSRLDVYQLRFLMRARWLLAELKNRFEIDDMLVSSLLSQVIDFPRLDTYLDLTSHFLPALSPIKRETTLEKLHEQRRQLVVEWSVPAVAAEIERIMEDLVTVRVREAKQALEGRMIQVEQHAQQAVENFKHLQVFQQQVAERFSYLERRVQNSKKGISFGASNQD